jgi:hypothetical protein
MSQGQIPDVDSIPQSTVVDSARVGSLIYRAATTLKYPKQTPIESKVAIGDLATSLTLTNAGLAETEITVPRCPLTLRAFMAPNFKPITRISDFPTTTPCFTSEQKLGLRPGESRQLQLSSRGWKHGRFGLLGPLYFVAELKLPDTTVRLRTGKTEFASDISSLAYSASSVVEGVAPARLMTRVKVSNDGELPVGLHLDPCGVTVRAFRTADRSGKVVWRSDFAAPPFIKNSQIICRPVLTSERWRPVEQ